MLIIVTIAFPSHPNPFSFFNDQGGVRRASSWIGIKLNESCIGLNNAYSEIKAYGDVWLLVILF